MVGQLLTMAKRRIPMLRRLNTWFSQLTESKWEGFWCQWMINDEIKSFTFDTRHFSEIRLIVNGRDVLPTRNFEELKRFIEMVKDRKLGIRFINGGLTIEPLLFFKGKHVQLMLCAKDKGVKKAYFEVETHI